MMRINLIGNLLNLAFISGRLLQKKGYQVKVFIDKKDSEYYQPHWDSPELKEFPEWVEVIDVDFKKLFWGTNERNLIKKLRDCDIIHAFGESVIWARWTGKPCVFLSYGGDLEILPFKKRRLKSFIFAYLLKDALHKADVVLYGAPRQEKSVKDLKLTNGRFFPYGVPIDVDRYKPFSRDEKKKLRARYDANFIFFHPARQDWTGQDWTDPDTNDKGNDKLFRAFARFIKSTKRRAILIAVDKGVDVEKSKELINQLGIARYVEWINPLDKKALVEMLNTVDLCFDQFAYGFCGLVALEALSVGVPTFLYLDDREAINQDAPPIVNVFSEDDIYEKMIELTANRNKLVDIGKSSREWILKYPHSEKVIDRYLDLYKEVLNTRSKVGK
ncbi:MAG: glycosyltransferase family 4 protein [Candidatus Omnitrophica bacterium]|nr:glycosyltransferase family 4 protein [Candidatus Omnitrophota bacterium]